jgi:pimeloyl-ACP methyl ester carboxylesterase
MRRVGRARIGSFLTTWLLAAVCLPAGVHASTLVLKDGRVLQGRVGKTSGLADNPLNADQAALATITFVDDDLRRVFFPTFQIRAIEEVNSGDIPQRINVRQNVAKQGGRIGRVGPIISITKFDNFGRRVFTMNTNKGPLSVIQGITVITPVWTKVEGLVTSELTPLVWDMRIATSSIPRETLHAILVNNTNRNNIESRLRIVRLLLQAERFADAQLELEGVIADFPKRDDLEREVQAIKQLHARSIVKEIEMRREAGQHKLAYTLLEKFPTKDVAGEILQQVRGMLGEYNEIQKKYARIDDQLDKHVQALADDDQKKQCQALLDEMRHEAGVGTLDRMAAYLRLSDDASLGPGQKLSLAFSGWLLGSDDAQTNLPVTLSLAKVRDIVHRYMNEPVKLKRQQLLGQLRTMEGAAPTLVARLISHMKPPLETPEPSVATPGYYTLTVPIGIDREPDVTYYVQLPPQYDPYVRYPTIVTLNGAGTTPENQVDWWTGARDNNGNRLGQATRRGYIVIAVDWLKEGQTEYGFTAREHAAVLTSLRDACRRFSIDTDRVFLSGHSIGGDAAWDLGLAHPDLWAGVIPIVAQARKYCAHYWQNARLVPFYVVQGELDGDKIKDNARDLDRYMTHRYDVTVVEYQGRGHEDFYEDIQHIFDWMARRESRDFSPKEFEVSTMRTWDNYFWWLEATKLPARAMVDPSDWPPARGVRPAELKGKVLATGDILVNSGGIQATIWLSPDVVDPKRGTINVTVAGRRASVTVEPDVSVLLEDVRTRGDRLHPFWAKVEP